jgi:hypothetical protein
MCAPDISATEALNIQRVMGVMGAQELEAEIVFQKYIGFPKEVQILGEFCNSVGGIWARRGN